MLHKILLQERQCCTWDKVFKNGPSKICGRQPLKNLKAFGLPKSQIMRDLISNLSSFLPFPNIWLREKKLSSKKKLTSSGCKPLAILN